MLRINPIEHEISYNFLFNTFPVSSQIMELRSVKPVHNKRNISGKHFFLFKCFSHSRAESALSATNYWVQKRVLYAPFFQKLVELPQKLTYPVKLTGDNALTFVRKNFFFGVFWTHWNVLKRWRQNMTVFGNSSLIS